MTSDAGCLSVFWLRHMVIYDTWHVLGLEKVVIRFALLFAINLAYLDCFMAQYMLQDDWYKSDHI